MADQPEAQVAESGTGKLTIIVHWALSRDMHVNSLEKTLTQLLVLLIMTPLNHVRMCVVRMPFKHYY